MLQIFIYMHLFVLMSWQLTLRTQRRCKVKMCLLKCLTISDRAEGYYDLKHNESDVEMQECL